MGNNINSVTSLSDLINNQAWPQNSISGCLRVNGTLVVDVPYTFSNIDARMAAGAEIRIEKDLLINENSHLYACALEGQHRLWKGITVLPNARLDFWDSEINDAKYAVEAQAQCNLHVENVLFDENYVGVRTLGYNHRIHNPISNLVSNEFTCRGTILPSWIDNEDLGNISFCGVYGEGSVFFNVGNPYNKDILNTFTSMRNGIVLTDAYATSVGGAEFLQIGEEFNDAAIRQNRSFETIVNYNITRDVFNGIYCIDSDISMVTNEIEATLFGVYLGELTNKEVFISGRNIIKSAQNDAIYAFQCIAQSSLNFSIEDNEIEGRGGIYLEQVTGPVYIHDNANIHSIGTGGSNAIRINRCVGPILIKSNPDIFANVNSGITITESVNIQVVDNFITGGGTNSVNLSSHGILARDARNILYCCNTVNNSSSGVQFLNGCEDTRLWNTVFNNHYLSEAEKATIRSISEQCPEIGGYGVSLARTIRSLFEELPENLCEPLVQQREEAVASMQSEQSDLLFPNPANDHITVSLDGFKGSPDLIVQVLDSNGKVHTTLSVSPEAQNVTIRTESFPNGLYFIRLYDGERFLQGIKFIVNH